MKNGLITLKKKKGEKQRKLRSEANEEREGARWGK